MLYTVQLHTFIGMNLCKCIHNYFYCI